MTMGKFELKDLYSALDSRREARGLTWTQVMREMNAVGTGQPRHPIAASTVTGLRKKRVAEGAGVLQMLRWLRRSAESFLPACSPALLAKSALPEADRHEVLRFDTRKLFEALDEQPASHIRGLARGGCTGFPGVVQLTVWLNQPVANFVRRSPF